MTVLDRLGRPVTASKLFHSGDHPTLRVTTREGYELAGTHNHPVLCLADIAGVPMLLWKLLEEIATRRPSASLPQAARDRGPLDDRDRQRGLLLGAFVSEGFVSDPRAGFNNVTSISSRRSSTHMTRSSVAAATSGRQSRREADLRELDVASPLRVSGEPACRARAASAHQKRVPNTSGAAHKG